MKETIMNQKRLTKLQRKCVAKKAAAPRKKVICRITTAGDKKQKQNLSSPYIEVNNNSHTEEVNMFANQGTMIHFHIPEVQMSLAANTVRLRASISHQPGADSVRRPALPDKLGWKNITCYKRGGWDNDEVPDPVERIQERGFQERCQLN
ncbi:LOW QUALITY PROTEIN: Transcription factor BTF3 [Galemys pyrenaicus]|uniref:Transcription factor BTF3 n=1 Tax=Galemys pyrenaicus TaxID=202257 RepID=A0A8J6AQB8_GALPY|nr:LOW QUALITY PROTEIN: Transcription factor BTF3 [Galemys pyrenaicus]